GEGDRAAFLRVQVELARCWRDPPRRAELLARQRGLLAKHRAAWLAPLAGLATDVRFERGLARVTLPAATYLALPGGGHALARAWARTVGLEGGPGQLAAVFEAPQTRLVPCLDLGGNRLGDEGAAALAELARGLDGRLHRLELGNAQIGDAGARA